MYSEVPREENELENLPSIELLEEMHSFPCVFMFKVIGGGDRFIPEVLEAFREELEIADDPRFSMRQTPSGRHVAMTLEPEVESAEVVLGIYSRVSKIDGLVMLC